MIYTTDAIFIVRLMQEKFREDAMDRSRWRKQIGIFDDHDGCEWVKFLLVLAHPGCPGQSPGSPKMVVVAVVE